MKEDEVTDAINQNEFLEFIHVAKQGDWRAVMARKR